MLLLTSGLHADLPVTADIKEPQAIRVVKPLVPPSVARAGLKGEVIAHFRLDDNGRPREIRIVDASHPDLATSVKNALRSWRFEHSNGTEIIYGLPFVFN